MPKNSSKKIDENDNLLLAIQEKTKKDLENFANNSVLLDGVKAYQNNLELLTRTIDAQRISEFATSAMKQFSNVEDKIRTLSKNFQVTMPSSLGRMAEAIKAAEASRFEGRVITYSPSRMKSFERVEYNLTHFIQKVENKMEAKLDELNQAIDKKLDSNKMKVVKNKNAHCKFCGHLLMKVQFMFYFGDAEMKCPECRKLIKVPDQLTFKEI